MRADFKVVLDACVLANFGVCDLLLRLAERPRLYLPRWSEELLRETKRTHVHDLGWPVHIAEGFQAALRQHFPEAQVDGYDHLLSLCNNDPKDHHVLACAVQCQAELILTFNLRDFPPESLHPWKIEAKHPQDYLLTLYALDQAAVLHKLEQIAHRHGYALEDHLINLGQFLPSFASRVLESLDN